MILESVVLGLTLMILCISLARSASSALCYPGKKVLSVLAACGTRVRSMLFMTPPVILANQPSAPT